MKVLAKYECKKCEGKGYLQVVGEIPQDLPTPTEKVPCDRCMGNGYVMEELFSEKDVEEIRIRLGEIVIVTFQEK